MMTMLCEWQEACSLREPQKHNHMFMVGRRGEWKRVSRSNNGGGGGGGGGGGSSSSGSSAAETHNGGGETSVAFSLQI